MELLKTVLGDELFAQVKNAIDAHNGDDANKETQIKLANLAGGEYIGKGKHDALQAAFDGKNAELQQANDLIEQLKKDSKGNEEMQGKIDGYEQQVAHLQAELAQTKMQAAIKVALLSEKAVDIDYLTFKLNEKLKEKGETLEFDDNEQIKGWDDKLAGLKTQFPTMFAAAGEGGSGYVPIDNGGLPQSNGSKTVTKEQFRAMDYNERAKLKEENAELFKQLNATN